MKFAILALILLAPARDEETYKVVLTFESMHCSACQQGVESGLKALEGTKKVQVDASKNMATVTIMEKRSVSYKAFRIAIPRDIKIKAIEVTIRGVASVSGSSVTLQARISNQKITLVNHGKKDPIADLKKQIAGGKSKFRIIGILNEKKGSLGVVSFAAVDWKD